MTPQLLLSLVAAVLTAVSSHSQAIDTDGDGLDDAIEQQIVAASSADRLITIADVLPEHDFDLDRRSNLVEMREGTSPIVEDFCYPVSARQRQAWAENDQRLRDVIGSERFAGTWLRNWNLKNFHPDALVEPNQPDPGIVNLHPLTVDTGSIYQYVQVPKQGVPVLRFDAFTSSDCYLAIFVNSIKVWESPYSGDWRTFYFDLRPWAGRTIQLEIVQGAGGPNGIWHFEGLWMRAVAVQTLNQAPAGLISPQEFLEPANCRWHEEWILRDEAVSANNDGVPAISGLVDGRSFVLNTHPPSETAPAYIERVVRVSSSDPYMRMVFRASQDFLLKVYVGNSLLLSEVIRNVGWITNQVDLTAFAGQTVPIRIEHWAGGDATWSFENAHWADIFVTVEPTLSIRIASVEICWDTTPKVQYRLESSDSAAGGEWTQVGAVIVGDGAKHCVTQQIPVGQRAKYYRLVPVGQ